MISRKLLGLNTTDNETIPYPTPNSITLPTQEPESISVWAVVFWSVLIIIVLIVILIGFYVYHFNNRKSGNISVLLHLNIENISIELKYDSQSGQSDSSPIKGKSTNVKKSIHLMLN